MSPSVRPFDEVRYRALMDGLEAVEVTFSTLRDDNPNLRIDSGFFSKKVLRTLHKVKGRDHFYLERESIVNGPFGSTITSGSHLEQGYIALVRSLNINRGFFINDSDLVYISKEDNDLIEHSQLFKDDIVLSRVGSIGFFARVDSDMRTCNISSNNIGIRLDDFQEAEKHYILTYLNTATAWLLVNRRASGNVQPKLTVEELTRIPIPAFSSVFYDAISGMIVKSEDVRRDSRRIYRAAEDELERCLAPVGHRAMAENISVRSFAQSFLASGRLDAEYYQPKFDALLQSISGFETTTIPDEFHVFRNSGTDYAEGTSDVGVIKTKQLANDGIDCSNVESFFSMDTCVENGSVFLQQKDVVFASMGVGSLGKVCIFDYEGERKFVTDSTLRIYRQKKDGRVCPEVLCVYLQSAVAQELIYRYVVGSTGIINIYDSDIARIPIPILDDATQEKITEKIQRSFALRRKSEQLLEYAKRAVELAIESGEDAALRWLQEKTDAAV